VSAFPNVLSPIRLGAVELRNRFVMTGHVTGMAEDHKPQAQLRAYYRERAVGGVAMIVSEAASVHPTAAHMAEAINVWDARIVEHYRRVTAELHDLDCRFVVQLWHCGNNTDGIATGLPVWSASTVPGVMHHEIPHAVTTADIGELVSAYARSAANAARGGADGVELHMGHGYLPQQFMSPLTNHRDDEYGGPLANRLRFPLELLEAVRETVGEDAIVGVRLSVDEGLPGGLGVPEMQEIAHALTRAGRVSYVSASVGTYANMELQVAPMPTPPGHLAHLAEAVRDVVDVPVLAVGRMLTPALAERVVASGQADLIGMARELIADPDYVVKARDDRAESIRPCIGCNYCQSRLWHGTFVSCIHNPAAGRELELGHNAERPARTPKRVLVVGGGPAGLEAARAAANRGHEVTLVERRSALGGQLLLAARVESRREMNGVVSYLVAELEQEGVTVELDRELSASDILRAAPDVVIVATGSNALADDDALTGARVTVMTGREALDSADALADPVLVVDREGHVQGLSLAEHLLDRGKRVTYATPHTFPGSTIGAIAWVRLMQAVSSKGATLLSSRVLREVSGGQALLDDVFGGAPTTLDIGSVVIVGQNEANDRIHRELLAAKWTGDVIAVGDCVAPRHLDMAILEGRRAGLAV
jgi:2,4-dienoyl-CoA reductase-like NADH-dependent reductase (Old Yellow Enzyme family)